MSDQPVKIPKQPALAPAEDYYRLRREGIGFIEQMGSRQWTDYNAHDPGITILEALCFAITDLAYRISWDIKDLLAPAVQSADPLMPFPDQSFFTPREILTTNPCTPDDFRRLLIDLDAVRNAWIFCKECACDQAYYAWCQENQLRISAAPPDPGLHLKYRQVKPVGLYDVLIELEADPDLGDLNDHKLEHTYQVFDTGGSPHKITLELRFPQWKLEKQEEYDQLLNSTDAFARRNGQSFTIRILKFNLTSDRTDTTHMSDAELRNNWRNIFFVSYEIELQPGGNKITIENAAVRIFGDTTAKNQTAEQDVRKKLGDEAETGLIQRFRSKSIKVEEAVRSAKQALQEHRNLSEDYCRIHAVKVEDIAVCADVELAPDADIERVQARIWHEISQYFNPPIRFYTLQELMGSDVAPAKSSTPGSPAASNDSVNEKGLPVEEIFNGPALNNGFITSEELAAAGLKTVLRTSDILNRLMDIEGVIAVNNLLLSKYDEQGSIVKGAADPTWSAQAPQTPIFDANKSSAAWLLYVSELRQPRLYFNFSRFLFYKNGLPFLPRMDEALDTYQEISGEAERPKIKNSFHDLKVPSGTFSHPEAYFPVQYSLPLTYGIGIEALPSHASPKRQALAKQLKAYLMAFEQVLGNAYTQVAHIAGLFSLDPSIKQTYFIKAFSDADIEGYSSLFNGLDSAKLQQMIETAAGFHERRNRFLDHLLARFGEQFNEYALLLTNFQGEQIALEHLINDKISFLKAYPQLGYNRGKAFNYTATAANPGYGAGLKQRVSLLLGYPDLSFSWLSESRLPGPSVVIHYQLKDRNQAVWLDGRLTIPGNDESAGPAAIRALTKRMVQPAAYEIISETDKFRLWVKDKNNNRIGRHPDLFEERSKAEAIRDELLGWSSNDRSIVVEHLLLRPKFPGDALFDFCACEGLNDCDNDDPYSFRLTFVMPGWVEPFNVNMDMRRFADQTVRRETPAHLLTKVCWVGNDGFVENPGDQIVGEIAALLEQQKLLADTSRITKTEACDCANAVYSAFSGVFQQYYDAGNIHFAHPDALKKELENVFLAHLNPDDIPCAAVSLTELWADIVRMIVPYFQQIALHGLQFERFEDAWYDWLTANAAIDWTEERLQERIEAILVNNVLAISGSEQRAGLCRCATSILLAYGTDFYNWMNSNFIAGQPFGRFTVFRPPPVKLCTGYRFKSGTTDMIGELLANRYQAYREVSYRLKVLVSMLGTLSNTYPGATLHDCDDGSDQNPVRLGSTALGNYPLRRSAEPPPENDKPVTPGDPPSPGDSIPAG